MSNKINYTKLVALQPTIYCTMVNSLGQTIELVEHPIYGDEREVVAVCHELKLAAYTGFFETNDMTDESGEYQPAFIDNDLYIGSFQAD
jgi:hypothetical protein